MYVYVKQVTSHQTDDHMFCGPLFTQLQKTSARIIPNIPNITNSEIREISLFYLLLSQFINFWNVPRQIGKYITRVLHK